MAIKIHPAYLAALRAYAAINGADWKTKLAHDWATGRDYYALPNGQGSDLRSIRNAAWGGVDFLDSFEFPAEESSTAAETKPGEESEVTEDDKAAGYVLRIDGSTQWATVYSVDGKPIATVQRRRTYERGPAWKAYATDGTPLLSEAGNPLVAYSESALRRRLSRVFRAAETKPGDTVNGYPVIRASLTPARGANRAGRVILVDRASGDGRHTYNRFVTAWQGGDAAGGWDSQWCHGHYFESQAEAEADFTSRVNRGY